MKNLSTILSGLALLGVIILFILHFSGKPTTKKAVSSKDTMALVESGSKIVYVDIDTFNEKFNYLREKREAFVARTEAMQRELQQSGQQMQREYQALQKKAQEGKLTEADGKAGEARIMQMEQSLKTRESNMSKQLGKEQEEFNTDLQKRLQAFLEQYNQDHNYDYIFYYTAGAGAMLYAEKNLNITNDVLAAVNNEFGDGKSKKDEDKK